MDLPEQDLDEVEIEDNFNEVEEEIPFQYSITSYGAEPMVDGLVRRLKTGDIIIPDFQRRFVWNIQKSSKFIESLLLGLPVPGIFLARVTETEELLVIDGNQRLQTLLFFYEEYFVEKSTVFRLRGIKSEFEGLKYTDLDDDDRRRLDNSIIHATIVQQNEPSEDDSSIYLIFERLNTGGVLLSAQEIRSAIYRGKLNDLLKELNENIDWRQIFGKKSKRCRDIELILRFIALYYHLLEYDKPMKNFLNKYMVFNKNLEKQGYTELSILFNTTVKFINNNLEKTAFRPVRGINAAVYDSVMIGVAKRLEKGIIKNRSVFVDEYIKLLNNKEYQLLYNSNTTDKEVVLRRIELAIDAFKDIQ